MSNLFQTTPGSWVTPPNGVIENGTTVENVSGVQLNNPIQWQGQVSGNSAILKTDNALTFSNGDVGKQLWSGNFRGGRVQTPRPKYGTNLGASAGPDLTVAQNLFVQVGTTPPLSSLYPTVS